MMFHGARLKVERANKHIGELHARIDAFLESDGGGPSVHLDEEDGISVVRISFSEFPADLSPIIGDIFHNLRSALDHMWDELIRSFGGAPRKRTNFPIHGDENGLIGALNDGPIKAVPQPIRDFILSAVQPYKGGNDALYAVHNLNNKDKHIVLTPVLSVIGLAGFSVEDVSTGAVAHLTDDNRLVITSPNSGGEYTVTLSIIPGYKVTDYGDLVTDIIFGKGNALANEPIIPTVTLLSQAVLRGVEDIAKLCYALRRKVVYRASTL